MPYFCKEKVFMVKLIYILKNKRKIMAEKLWEAQYIEKINTEKKINKKLEDFKNKSEKNTEELPKEEIQIFNILKKIEEENPNKNIILDIAKDNKLYLIIDWDKNPVWLSREQFIDKYKWIVSYMDDSKISWNNDLPFGDITKWLSEENMDKMFDKNWKAIVDWTE